MSGRIQVQQFKIDPPPGQFPALRRAAEVIVILLRQRRAHDDRFPAAGKRTVITAFHSTGFFHREFRRKTASHLFPAEKHMVRLAFRDQQRRENHTFRQSSSQVKRTANPDPVRQLNDFQIQHAEIQFRGKTVFSIFLPDRIQFLSCTCNFRTAQCIQFQPADFDSSKRRHLLIIFHFPPLISGCHFQ